MRGVSKRHEGTSTCNFRRRHTSLAYVPGNHNQPPADADDLKSNKMSSSTILRTVLCFTNRLAGKNLFSHEQKKRVERTRKYGD